MEVFKQQKEENIKVLSNWSSLKTEVTQDQKHKSPIIKSWKNYRNSIKNKKLKGPNRNIDKERIIQRLENESKRLFTANVQLIIIISGY